VRNVLHAHTWRNITSRKQFDRAAANQKSLLAFGADDNSDNHELDDDIVAELKQHLKINTNGTRTAFDINDNNNNNNNNNDDDDIRKQQLELLKKIPIKFDADDDDTSFFGRERNNTAGAARGADDDEDVDADGNLRVDLTTFENAMAELAAASGAPLAEMSRDARHDRAQRLLANFLNVAGLKLEDL
jgi:hypothetical protein